ncbi:MAG: hypothetical protein ACK56F_31925, partial [bacterium]
MPRRAPKDAAHFRECSSDTGPMLQQISLATEGLDDQAVALKLCAKLSIPVKASCQAAGKSRLEPKLPAYNQAAALGS